MAEGVDMSLDEFIADSDTVSLLDETSTCSVSSTSVNSGPETGNHDEIVTIVLH